MSTAVRITRGGLMVDLKTVGSDKTAMRAARERMKARIADASREYKKHCKHVARAKRRATK